MSASVRSCVTPSQVDGVLGGQHGATSANSALPMAARMRELDTIAPPQNTGSVTWTSIPVSESISFKSSVPEILLLTKPKVLPDDDFLDGKIFP